MAEVKGRSGSLRVNIRYYKRMRRGKVYPATVRWAHNPGTDMGNVTVRLLVGGAQVVPAEVPLDASNANAQATFFVTPLAKGWLRGEHIEVIVGGKKVAETATPAKVTSQRMTWMLLLLTFLVPLYVAPYFTTDLFDFEPRDPQTGQPLLNPKTGQPIVLKKPQPGGLLRPTTGERLEAWLLYLEDRYCPPVPETLVDWLGLKTDEKGYAVLAREWTSNQREVDRTYTVLTTAGPSKAKDLYDVIVHYVHDWPLAYWSAVVLFALTVLSLLWHREKRTRRESKPFALS